MELPDLDNSWGNSLLRRFTDQISYYTSAFVEKALPALAGIEDEADQKTNAIYAQISRMPSDGYDDSSDAAEYAIEVGVEHYELLWAARQSMISIAIAGLHHLFEQQVHFFMLKEVIDPRLDSSKMDFRVNDLVKSMEIKNIDVNVFENWSKIRELRLIANSIKHGEGWAAKELKSVRPDLFEDPRFDDHLFTDTDIPHLVAPLAGEELYPTIDDLIHFEKALLGFWIELLSMYFDPMRI